MTTWAVVLAGGVGSRFWPWSTAVRPKQLLPLISDRPMLVDTLERLAQLAPPERTLVLTGARVAEASAAAAAEIPPGNVLAEPAPAGTAAALAWAAITVQARGGGEDVMVCVHADWTVRDPETFVETLKRAAAAAAESNALVTVGIVPDRDEPGYGYVVPGAPHPAGARTVERFVEKPTRERAAALRLEGALWNSGIFAWRVNVFLEELRRHTPEVSAALQLRTADEFFARVQPVSVDVGLLERSSSVLVIPGDFGWDDVGTWAALLRAREADGSGNVTHGRVYARDASRNVAYGDGPDIVLYGVHDLVVVATGRTVMVTTAERAADLKQLVESLPPELRDEP